ncbi:hypothetical protein SAMN05421839_1506 [Halolactibacillus halophilus]|uniref:Uncharacterized protein n=1 Tax=Halolactibacillus halophilus TaxID=306540 RepID=A0A1I5SRK7_9BACI|nr:hypothetical protein SAMN05421839_1506 [Halolactibacillus halophilus]
MKKRDYFLERYDLLSFKVASNEMDLPVVI